MNSQYLDLSDRYTAKEAGYYETPRGEMLEFIPADSKLILDVGCGSGTFGEIVKAQRPDAEVWGIEPDTASAAAASLKLDNVICGTFSAELEEIRGMSFDLISMNDVLEHLVYPETALRDCKQLLSKDGIVVASIPNVLHFYNILNIVVEEDWRYEELGIMDNTHLRFFTKKSMIRMFESCGYEVLRIQGINPSFGLKYRAANLLTLGRLDDWKYIQFAVQARIRPGAL